jgi:Chaperone of endosialidase
MVQKLLVKRTETSGNKPAGLLPGELAMEMAHPHRLWMGVPSSMDPEMRKLVGAVIIADQPPSGAHGQLWWETDTGILWVYYFDGNTSQWVQVGSAGGGGGGVAPDMGAYVLKAGDTMQGFLTLHAHPTMPFHAATKQYVDDNDEVGSGGTGISEADADLRYVKKTGDTMTGELINLYNVKSAHFTVRGAASGSNQNAQLRFNDNDDTARGLLFYSVDGSAGLNWNRMTKQVTFYTTGTVEMPYEGWKVLNTNFRGYVDPSGTFNTLQMSDNFSYVYNRQDGHIYLKYQGGNNAIWYSVNGNHYCAGVWVAKPGGGFWADSSDARIKNVVGDYTQGLQAILALNPVRYTFKGNDYTPDDIALPQFDPMDETKAVTTYTEMKSLHHYAAESGKEFIGLVADDVEPIMPELISTMEPTVVDGVRVTDLRGLDCTAIVFALINAVKELKAEIDALKAALPVP